ncbi:MAG TPA: hypothetical protein VLF20_05675, partial [Patescibacteria group bacterium]|nr:hypothetical protein [Patescibacteria group bacterium]
MSERRAPTGDKIFAIEQRRVRGFYAQSARATRPVVDEFIHGVSFTALSLTGQKEALMNARIYVNSKLSLARNASTGRKVAGHLRGAKEAIESVYHDSRVRREARRITTDIRGTQYEFATEMVRDEAKYLLVLAELTGNAVYVTEALRRFDRALRIATEPTIKTLVAFEKARVLFDRQRTPKKFSRVTDSFRKAVIASSEAGNWERTATISAWYLIDA